MTPAATATAEMLPPVDVALIAAPVGVASLRAAPVAVGPAATARPLAATISQLVRPRITVMVLATVATAAWLTGGRPVEPVRLVAVLVGTALVAASSSIVNQIVERRTDRLMPRTAGRPLAAGDLGVSLAAWWSAALLVVGAAVVTVAGGWPAAAAAVATWLIYVVVYTPMKLVSPLNTAVGAIAGALPVAIGWLAADGPARLAAGDARGGLAAAALAGVLYLWQFPHFMAIAWLYRRHYAAAGLQMLTVVDPTGLRAAGQALSAALAMVPVSLVLAVPSGSVRLFLAAAVAAVAYAVATARFAIRRDDATARTLLLTSLATLLGLLCAAVAFGRPV
jgi:protoheme IX farnesyltransferase